MPPDGIRANAEETGGGRGGCGLSGSSIAADAAAVGAVAVAVVAGAKCEDGVVRCLKSWWNL